VLREPPSIGLPGSEAVRVGWREPVALPAFGSGAIKAKLDSGARSSALHVEGLDVRAEEGAMVARFRVRVRRRGHALVACAAPVCDRRRITDSGGHQSERWFIRTTLVLAGIAFEAEVSLADRAGLLFPLLLGRSAIASRFLIDPALSYTLRPPRRPRPHALPIA
jgi:hypothetical protein